MIIERAQQAKLNIDLAREAENKSSREETERSLEDLSLPQTVVIAEQLAVARHMDESALVMPTEFDSAILTLDAMSLVNWAASHEKEVMGALDHWTDKSTVDQIFPYPSRSNRASQKASNPARVRNTVNPEDAGNIRRQEKLGFVRQVQGREAMVTEHNAHMEALKREVMAFYDNPPTWVSELTCEARRIVEEENNAPDSPTKYTAKQKAGTVFMGLSLLLSPINNAIHGDKTPTHEVKEQTQAVVYTVPENPINEARTYMEERLRQKEQNLFSVEKINLNQTDAETITRGNLPIENARVIQEINIESDLVFESQDLQKKVDYAKGWVRDLRAQGYKVSLKTIYDYEEGKLPTEVGIVISIDSDFKWGEVEVKAGGFALIDAENNLHFINPSSDMPNTKIEFINLDQNTIDALKETYRRLGYGILSTPEPGSWIAIETDEDGDILQIITEIYADFLIHQRLSGPSNINVRSQPTTASEVIQRGVDAETEVLTPTAVPPEERLEGEREEGTLLFISAEGYNWTRVITKSGAAGFVAYEVLGVGIVKEAAGPRVKSEHVFKTLEAINYFDSKVDPHLAYGITEEVYVEEKQKVIDDIPERIRDQVISEAAGYSHKDRAFVKKVNGVIYYWRPGMGNEAEDGWLYRRIEQTTIGPNKINLIVEMPDGFFDEYPFDPFDSFKDEYLRMWGNNPLMAKFDGKTLVFRLKPGNTFGKTSPTGTIPRATGKYSLFKLYLRQGRDADLVPAGGLWIEPQPNSGDHEHEMIVNINPNMREDEARQWFSFQFVQAWYVLSEQLDGNMGSIMAIVVSRDAKMIKFFGNPIIYGGDYVFNH